MNNKLFDMAKLASKNSYSIFSHFKVSAAIELKDGRIFTGVNIENSSYPESMCAERVCLFKAYSEGVRKDDIKSLLIYHPGDDQLAYPCGGCRQVMSDLMNHSCVIAVSNDKEYKEFILGDLLPYSFTPENLK